MKTRWRRRLTDRWLGPALVFACLGIALGAAQEEPTNRRDPEAGPAAVAPDGKSPVKTPPVEDKQAEAAAIHAPAEQQHPVAPVSVERQPYRVEVRVGFESAPGFNNEFRRSVLDEIGEGLQRYVGEFWHCTIAKEQGKVFSGLAGLQRLRADTLPREAIASDVQKVFLLSVQASGAGFQVSGREWDTLARQLGAMVVDRVYDRREIPETALAVMYAAFRPIVAVEASKSGAITLRARGGEYPPRDESWLPLLPGKTFEIFYCFLNKDRLIERIQQVPFTYLASDETADRGVAKGKVTSGLRAPLTPRRRIQFLALGINSRAAETRLTLVTRPPARRPLAGVEVEVFQALPPNDGGQVAKEKNEPDGKEPQGQDTARLKRLVADRNGLVKIAASVTPSGVPVWLVVKSGQALLARVPFVPGAQGAELLELPDDTLRLETEGSIAALQAELVDTVARRAVLMSLVKTRSKTADWNAIDALFKQIDELPKATTIAADVNAIRIPALKTARSRHDRNTEARIQKLCEETLELSTNYLDQEKVKELREDMNEMRRIAADEAAAEALAKGGGPKKSGDPKQSAAAPKKKKKAAAPATGPPKPPVGF